MKDKTELLVQNMLLTNRSISPKTAMKILSILKGVSVESLYDSIMSYKDVAKLLHVKGSDVRYFIGRGLLTPVFQGASRSIGISRNSFLEFVKHPYVIKRKKGNS